MLGKLRDCTTQLYIPDLQFVHKIIAATPMTIFELNWKNVDTIKSSKSALKRSTLPAQYDERVSSLRYMLKSDYVSEINHFTQLFLLEWNRNRKFDTMVRDACLEPAIAAINAAFYLLSDCVYDDANKQWFKEDNLLDRLIIRCLLKYKFWRDFTGSGLVRGHAEIHRLVDRYDSLSDDSSALLCQGRCKKCLDALNQFEKGDAYQHITELA